MSAIVARMMMVPRPVWEFLSNPDGPWWTRERDGAYRFKSHAQAEPVADAHGAVALIVETPPAVASPS